MKNRIVLVVFSLFLAILPSFLPESQVHKELAEPAACVPGPHHGFITTSETWCPVNNPHYVDYGVTVASGATLTIEPGVVVKFYSGASLGVAGSLIANGTAGQPITFTSNQISPTPGSWQAVLAVDGSSLQLSHCELAYAGQPGFAFGSLAIYTTDATISHCRIHHVSGTAVFLDNNGITPQFNDVEIDHSTGVGLYQNKISMNPSYQNIRLHDNAWDGLQIAGGATTDRDVILDGSPAALNGAPIYIGYTVTVGSGTTMTITPGTTLKNSEGISVAANAILIAEGTPTEPILFTTIQDPPAPGGWVGIIANPGSTLKLSYCEMAYAGKPGYWVGALNVATSDATVRQCRIHHSLGHGIYLHGAHPSPLWNDVLTDIAEGAIVVDGGGQLEAMHATLAHNKVGIYVSSGSALLTNTIVANNTTGVQQANTGAITLNNTLFQDNTTAAFGTVTDINHIDGVAAFNADGYHLSKASDAIDVGVETADHYDIDGDPRPIGAVPDLGADEYRDAIGFASAASGGSLAYVDEQGNSLVVTVPPGAVRQDTVLALKVIDSVTPPFTYQSTRHAFYLDGYQGENLVPGLAFDQLVEMTLHYSDADVLGLDKKTLSLWYWSGTGWSRAACGQYVRHPNENWLSLPLCHLSRFSFFAQHYRITLPLIRRN